MPRNKSGRANKFNHFKTSSLYVLVRSSKFHAIAERKLKIAMEKTNIESSGMVDHTSMVSVEDVAHLASCLMNFLAINLWLVLE